MRIFHELIFDAYIEGGGKSVKNHWGPVLGNLDTMRFIVIADRVSVTSGTPLISVGLAETPDQTEVIGGVKTVLNNVILTAGQSNFVTGYLEEAIPWGYASLLTVALGGTNPKAHVRMWVTGRGRA